MEQKQELFQDNFFYDIENTPGRSDDLVLKAIEHYKYQLNNPNLSPHLKDCAHSFIENLSQYYQMSDLDGSILRQALLFLSDSATYMYDLEKQNPTILSIESTARIKSFFSTYLKLTKAITNKFSHEQIVPQTDDVSVKDIYATTECFHNDTSEDIYKTIYKIIYQYMQYIDKLKQDDPKYGFVSLNQYQLQELKRPVIYTDDISTISIPEHDFTYYALREANIPEGFRYLAEIPQNHFLITEISQLKHCDLSKPETYSNFILYKELVIKSQKDSKYKLRNILEEKLLHSFEQSPSKSDMIKNYKILSTSGFLEKYRLSSLEIEICNFIDHMNTILLSQNDSLPIYDSRIPSDQFKQTLTSILDEIKQESEQEILKKLQSIQQIDLDNFHSNLAEANKIHYYSLCLKDYMINPKSNLYQSVHMTLSTPFGHLEKQFVTKEQKNRNDFGSASHSKVYKPDEKKHFNALQVPMYLSFKRDNNGELIYPRQYYVLPFEQNVKNFYGISFEDFAGKKFSDFQEQYKTEEKFDQALLDLSRSNTIDSSSQMQKLKSEVLRKLKLIENHFDYLQKTTKQHFDIIKPTTDAEKTNTSDTTHTDPTTPHSDR